MMSPVGARCVVMATLALTWLAGSTAGAAEVTTPRQAIERAALDRLGASVVQVEVGSVATTVQAHAGLIAVPDPAGYVGQTVRFALMVNGRRSGVAVASVRVRARMARAVKPIERDQRIEADAVTIVEDEVEGVRFARLPQLQDIVGSRARRDIAPGVVVTSGMFAAPLDVQSGERVTLGVTVGHVHVTGEGIASGSGYVGDVVHVMQTGRRGLLKGRITERGVVEVMP